MAKSLAEYPNFLYKAFAKQGAVALIPTELKGKIKKVSYIGANGEIQSNYSPYGESETSGMKFTFGTSGENLGPGKVRVELDDGQILEQEIKNPGANDFRNGQEVPAQNINSGPGAAGGDYSGPYAPGAVGFGAVPAYLGGEYPTKTAKAKFKPINFDSIDYSPISYDATKAADYDFTDPLDFAKKFGGFNRSEIKQNYSLAKDLALDQLDTELKGLEMFAPAAAALKRGETSLDNIFNQQQRTAQVDATLPGARADLEAQRGRANTYARGEIPNSVTDRALELGVRSRAADTAYAGGFGSGSSVARKISDLASAEDRLKIAEYGEGLLGTNLNTSASLLLAPTEYSDAGSQIKVTPQINAGVQAGQNATEINNNTLINPTNALTSQVQQRQFGTQLQQQTNQFNATNRLATSQFNASNTLNTAQFNANTRNNVNQFNATSAFQRSQINTGRVNELRMGRFAYDVSYAGAVAGASQLNINTQLALQQQAQAAQIFQDQMKAAQNSAQTGAIAGGIAAILPQLTSLIDSVKSLFHSNETNPTKTPGTVGTAPSSSSANSYPDSSIYPSLEDGAAHGGAEGSAWVPPGEDVPDGFTPVASSDGGVIAIPDETYSTQYQSFLSDLNLTN